MTSLMLRGMTWSHPRGLNPLLACSADYLREHEVEVQWDARSLQDFADYPLAQLADKYDLIVFDHPFVGELATSNHFLPLDNLLLERTLEDLSLNSVGRSHSSYEWAGRQWALAIDAACHVSVRRPDLVEQSAVPSSWSDVVTDGRARKRRGDALVGLPLLPIDSFLAFLTIAAGDQGQPFADDGRWVDLDATSAALDQLAELEEVAHPGSRNWNPIQMLETMATSDVMAYAPLTFGYVNYSTPGFRNKRLAFSTPPTPLGAGGVLGGAGLGISASTTHPDEAAAFVDFVASASSQAGPYAESGGQPGHRAAWLDHGVNSAAGEFYKDTISAMDGSYLRPRWPGYLQAQTEASELLHDWVFGRKFSSSQLATRLGSIFGEKFDSIGTRTAKRK